MAVMGACARGCIGRVFRGQCGCVRSLFGWRRTVELGVPLLVVHALRCGFWRGLNRVRLGVLLQVAFKALPPKLQHLVRRSERVQHRPGPPQQVEAVIEITRGDERSGGNMRRGVPPPPATAPRPPGHTTMSGHRCRHSSPLGRSSPTCANMLIRGPVSHGQPKQQPQQGLPVQAILCTVVRAVISTPPAAAPQNKARASN